MLLCALIVVLASHSLYIVLLRLYRFKNTIAPPSSYNETLLNLARYLDGVVYKKGTAISIERLSQLNPSHLMWWFNKITFDTEDPADNANPTSRSASLLFYCAFDSDPRTRTLVVRVWSVHMSRHNIVCDDMAVRLRP